MKKILIFTTVILLLQGFYILKLRHDLDIRKKINTQTIMEILDKTFECVNNEDKQITYTSYYSELPEPSDYNDNTDIVERIKMLEGHLDYNPSKKWIRDVLHHAKSKLEN